MTISEILNGPVESRENYARHLMTEAEARGILVEMESEVPSIKKRQKSAAFFAKNIFGKLSPEAVALYKSYSEAR